MTSRPDGHKESSAGICGMVSVAWLPWMVYVPESTLLETTKPTPHKQSAVGMPLQRDEQPALQAIVDVDDHVKVKLPADG